MMQPAESLVRKDTTRSYGTNPAFRCSLPESEMRAVLVVVADILIEKSLQVAFIECDDLIQQIAAATAYPSLRNSILPGLRNEVRTHLIFIDRIAAGTSAPYLASRSKMTNLGADPNGNASRNC